MSRFDELYQSELERLEALQAHLVQPGTEEEVLALHGKVLGLLDRVYFRVDVAAHKTYIRVLPLVFKKSGIPPALRLIAGLAAIKREESRTFTLPWASICWDERKNDWWGSWILILYDPSGQVVGSRYPISEHATLRDAVSTARKALNAQLPLTMLRHRLRVPRVDKLTSIFPSQEMIERAAEWRANYFLEVEEDSKG